MTHDGTHSLRVGLAQLHTVLGAPHFTRRHHFHRTGDLASIISYESPFIAKHHAKIILPQSAARKKEYGDIYDIVPEGKAGAQHKAHLDEITKDAPKVIHDDATGEVIQLKD